MKIISDFLSGSSPFIYIFIFFGKLIEVALASLRSQLIHKGHRLPGAFVALFEYSFWLCITASAISGFANDPIKVLLLIVAFSVGNVMGSLLEEAIAFGYCTVTGIFLTKETALKAADLIREKGAALTLIPAEGMLGAERTTLVISVKRKCVGLIKNILLSVDENVVITVSNTQEIKGSAFLRVIK